MEAGQCGLSLTVCAVFALTVRWRCSLPLYDSLTPDSLSQLSQVDPFLTVHRGRFDRLKCGVKLRVCVCVNAGSSVVSHCWTDWGVFVCICSLKCNVCLNHVGVCVCMPRDFSDEGLLCVGYVCVCSSMGLSAFICVCTQCACVCMRNDWGEDEAGGGRLCECSCSLICVCVCACIRDSLHVSVVYMHL